jgi:predicted nucleic acid-binding protein
MTLVDSNVLLDVVTDGEIWADWSQDQLERAALSGPLVINGVVYAEVSARTPPMMTTGPLGAARSS